MTALPNHIHKLYEKFDAPERLIRHHQIVYSVTGKLLDSFRKEWPDLMLPDDLILFGAGTHDIGKVRVKSELYKLGKEHEKAGQNLLIELGYSTEESRFTFTHGNWDGDQINIEDLLVSAADKIWKGKRIDELEEKLISKLSAHLRIDYWAVFSTVDKILSKIALDADQRLLWQNQ